MVQALKSILTSSSLKLIYLILAKPSVLKMGYRDIAEFAGISLGSASQSIGGLLKANYITRSRDKGFQIVDRKKLLNVWEIGYLNNLRPKLWIGKYSFPQKQFNKISEKIINYSGSCEYLIGGELGAFLLTQYLRPQQVTLHIKGDYEDVLSAFELTHNCDGEVTLINQFGVSNGWRQNEKGQRIVSPLLLIPELTMENNDRLNETSQKITIFLDQLDS